ncbi:MAG: translation initiation factor IF-1 [Deltaproteobacteria bacterium RBG_13_61_14]|nr:MAG: translation initiation factor IF-1 [Deltaproteobacteria bacterium RBG_13_61_14]
MSHADNIRVDGTVTKVHSGGIFQIECEGDVKILARLSGRMRRFRIRVLLGDKVTVAVSPYEPARGLIVRRLG